jgi:hypothetical protein
LRGTAPVFRKTLRTAGFVGGLMVEEFERECFGIASPDGIWYIRSLTLFNGLDYN